MSITKSFLEHDRHSADFVLPAGGPPLLARMGASLSGNEASARTCSSPGDRLEVGRYFGTVALIQSVSDLYYARHVRARHDAIRWGLLIAVFNFTTSAPPAAFILASIAALVTFETLGRALAVPGVFLCLHLVEGQIVQPLTVGRRFEVNALVVLLAVWFGYGFWGIPGMLLAMPVVVALKVAAQYQPSWNTVRDFLSPNGHWHPRSLKRLRVDKDPDPTPPAATRESAATRGS
jgi:hypothetical protein